MPGTVAAFGPAGCGVPATFRWPAAGGCAAPGMTGVPVVIVVGGRFVWAEAVAARLVAARAAPGAGNCGSVAAVGLTGVPGALVTRVGAARVGAGLAGFVSA